MVQNSFNILYHFLFFTIDKVYRGGGRIVAYKTKKRISMKEESIIKTKKKREINPNQFMKRLGFGLL